MAPLVTKPENPDESPLLSLGGASGQVTNFLFLLSLLRWVSFLELKPCWQKPGPGDVTGGLTLPHVGPEPLWRRIDSKEPSAGSCSWGSASPVDP